MLNIRPPGMAACFIKLSPCYWCVRERLHKVVNTGNGCMVEGRLTHCLPWPHPSIQENPLPLFHSSVSLPALVKFASSRGLAAGFGSVKPLAALTTAVVVVLETERREWVLMIEGRAFQQHVSTPYSTDTPHCTTFLQWVRLLRLYLLVCGATFSACLVSSLAVAV